jgi:hypothetical protein
MNATAPQFDLRELLEAEGVQFGPGTRPACPRCGKRGTLSVNFEREVFCCHHVTCDFRGNAFQLARAQGRLKRVSAGELREQARARHQADEGAAWLARHSRVRRLELYDAHRSLLRITTGASRRLKIEPDSEAAWNGLAYAYRELPKVRAELLLLEESPAAPLMRFLTASEEERASQIAELLEAGGITNWERKFVAVT